MSEKRKLNEAHPDYARYKEEFDALAEKMRIEEEQAEKQHPDFEGLDGPVAFVHKKYHVLLSALQKKYSYLYN